MKRILSYLIISFVPLSVLAQDAEVHLAVSKAGFDSLMTRIVEERYYQDVEEEIKLVFALRVDSVGQVLSAHIVWSVNMNSKWTYSLCKIVEDSIVVPFVLESAEDSSVTTKFMRVYVPFFSRLE